MPENSNPQIITPENTSSAPNISFKTRFFSLTSKKRILLIVAAVLVLWLLFSLLSIGGTADPIDIVKNSYLSGYPDATMGEILEIGYINHWSSESTNDRNLYIVQADGISASGSAMIFRFIVDVKEKAWELDSFSNNGVVLPNEVLDSVVGNLLDNWYIMTQY